MKLSPRFLGTFALSLLLGAQAQLLFDENSFDSVEEAPHANAGLGVVPGFEFPAFGHGPGKRDFQLQPRATTTEESTATTTATAVPTACAPKYSVAQMITRTGTLPKPTTFVKRRTTGNQQGLTLNGASFRIVGANIYWLCQDENVLPIANYTSKARIREALAMAVAMGANTVRLISCGTSVGNLNYSIEPSLNVFGSLQWEIHDYAIFAAKQYGLRVILPLTDNYQYYHGGKYTFLKWRNISTSNFGRAFYTNTQVIADFKAYVTHFINHKNPYTGVINGREPTIMAWETGNEMGAWQGTEGFPPASWTKAIAALCKQLAPSQLTIAGDEGILNPDTGAKSPALGISVVDIVSDHAYPRSISLLNKQLPLSMTAKKGFLIGEYDWTNNNGGDSLDSYLAAIEKVAYLGDMIWSLFGHDDQCCAFVQHDDGFSAYYPNGNSVAEQANLLKVVQHWYRMTGRTVPKVMPGVACPQPVF